MNNRVWGGSRCDEAQIPGLGHLMQFPEPDKRKREKAVAHDLLSNETIWLVSKKKKTRSGENNGIG